MQNWTAQIARVGLVRYDLPTLVVDANLDNIRAIGEIVLIPIAGRAHHSDGDQRACQDAQQKTAHATSVAGGLHNGH